MYNRELPVIKNARLAHVILLRVFIKYSSLLLKLYRWLIAVSYANHTTIHSPNDEKATMHLESLYSLFSQNTLVTDCFICRPYLFPPSRLLIFLSYTLKISFSLPIPYKFLTFEIASKIIGLKEHLCPKAQKNTDVCRFGVFCALNIEDSFYS